MRIKLATVEAKLEAVNSRFRHGSKQRDAARWIVRRDHAITTAEKKALIQEIPINCKTLQGVFTELRKLNLYPPQETLELRAREGCETPMSYTNPPLQQKARERLEALTHASQNVIEALAVWCAVKNYRDEAQFGHVSQAYDMFLAAVGSRTPRPRKAPSKPSRRRSTPRHCKRLRHRCPRRRRR